MSAIQICSLCLMEMTEIHYTLQVLVDSDSEQAKRINRQRYHNCKFPGSLF